MKKQYVNYDNITKEILDTIKKNDLIKCNDWMKPYKVIGVSENYFVMIRNNFGEIWYSVCEKKPWDGIRYNSMHGGMFHIGTDDYVLGYPTGYEWNNDEWINAYLNEFEKGVNKLSVRRTVSLYNISIKSS